MTEDLLRQVRDSQIRTESRITALEQHVKTQNGRIGKLETANVERDKGDAEERGERRARAQLARFSYFGMTIAIGAGGAIAAFFGSR